jgi:hypothetical protein
MVFTKQLLVALFEVIDTKIERYIATHGAELKTNGYKVLRGQALKDFLNATGGVFIN